MGTTTVMEVIDGGRLPVYSWAPELEEGARQQALNCAALPVAAHHVAVMADGHQGYGVPIGAVVALAGALSPYAVGNDIGCGMAIVPTTLTKTDLLPARDDVMGWVQTTIPSGQSAHRAPVVVPEVEEMLGTAFDAMEQAAAASGVRLSTSQSVRTEAGKPLTRHDFLSRGRSQLGTLGSGNHFIEMLTGPDDDVWVMVHSGSRGVGGAICNNFHRMAVKWCERQGHVLPDPGLAWLPMDGSGKWQEVGRCYEVALRAGLAFAHHNRRHMLEAVASIVERRFPGCMGWDGTINIHHNDAVLETHYDQQVWVHRKGAVKASTGIKTITPGSMGTATYLGVGLGRAEAFESCSHGAGRTRSRGKARAELSLQRELERVTAAGGKVFATSKQAVLDEMPGAYKDVDQVMEYQSDLVRVERRLTPLATYKGADSPKRERDRAKKWRPEEER